MNKRLTHAELAAAQERGDWPLLWGQATPLVKLVIKRMRRKGPVEADKDDENAELLQSGMLIAGEQMRTWRPIECAFSTHITKMVQWYLGHALAEKNNGGVGSRAQKPVILSLGDERPNAPRSEEGEDETDDDGTFGAALTYAGVVMPGGQFDGAGYVPQGFGDPSEEADVNAKAVIRAALQHLTTEETALVCSIYGIGGGQTQTLAEYAAARHIPYRTAKWQLAKIRTVLAPHLQKLPHS